MKKRILTYLLLITLLGFLTFLYGFSSNRNRSKKVENVKVEFKAGDNGFLTHESVNKLLIQNGKPVKNLSKSSVNLHELEKEVLANPYVEEATVFLTLDGTLQSNIKQREPIARIISKEKSYYVDKYGVEFPLSTNFSARVPLVLGVETPSEVEKITELVRFINSDDFFKKEIVGIQKNAKNDYFLTVRSGNYTIDLGAIENLKTKFKKLKAFYKKALLDGSIKKYKTITVKYRNQVVCTKQYQDGKQ